MATTAHRVNIAPVNRRALRKYGEFWRALQLVGNAVVCVNGGRRALRPGTWSASLEWLVERLAPSFPRIGFLEVRYRIKSWQVLSDCIQDCREAQIGRTTRIKFP